MKADRTSHASKQQRDAGRVNPRVVITLPQALLDQVENAAGKRSETVQEYVLRVIRDELYGPTAPQTLPPGAVGGAAKQ